MQIIYPSQLFQPKVPDEAFAYEYDCARQQGIPCLLLSSDAAAMGEYRFSGSFQTDVPVIWRGWMMTEDEYQQLHNAVTQRGAVMMISLHHYLYCHHLPNWYPLCRDFTPETEIVNEETNFATLLKQRQWPACFVKDYVKSLTTTRGSVARNADEIHEIIRLLKQYRGHIEGGVCLRQVESFKEQSERRYFVLNKKAYAADGVIPELVTEIARRIDSPFYSVDIAINEHDEPRLIEIGDGQVSDIKEWSTERFVEMLSGKA